MVRNYLKIMIRNIFKHKGYVLINVLGLTVALVVSVFAIAYIVDEISFDEFHSKNEKIFRLNKKNVSINDGTSRLTSETAGLMGPTLHADFPEVENFTRILPWFDDAVISRENENIKITNSVFVDSTFLEVFDFKLLRGNRQTVLTRPSSIVLSESLSKKLFKEEDPIGKVVKGLHDLDYEVTGVIEDSPRQSHIQYDVLISWSTTVPNVGPLSYDFMNNWLGQTLYTYIELKDGQSAQTLSPKLVTFMQRHFPERAESYFLYLQPLSEVYLHSDNITHSKRLKMSSATYLRVFGMAALFILLIACVNYININTARATKRAAEVGMRKVLGASRRQLVFQFMGESFLLTLIAAVLALLIVDLSLPNFNTLSGKELDLNALLNIKVVLSVTAVVLSVALLSGFYPALILSGFKPRHVLKMSAKHRLTGNLPRQVLTVVQFVIAIVMIASTIIVFQQTSYLKNKDLGFDKEQLVVMNINNDIEKRTSEFLSALESTPNVLAFSACQATIGNGTFGTTVIPEGADHDYSVSLFRTDANFITTIGMRMVEGRAFNSQLSSDSSSLIVNQAFVDMMGWETGVEKQVRFSPESAAYPIIGVVEDFHFQGLAQYAVEPVVMYIESRNLYNVTVRISGNNISETLRDFEKLWGQYESRFPFEYYFVDDWFDQQYKTQEQLFDTVSLFSIISIILASLGLYGLTAFTIEQKTKEIGIRKVLGATVSGLTLMVNKKFILLVLVAFVIAAPMIWYGMGQWLEDYAYKITLDYKVLLLAVFITMMITIITVSSQAVKAALTNPVNTLRND